jgi:hypothetical protein
MPSATDPRRHIELRITPGTPEYEEDQAMWRSLNRARHESLAFLGTAPKAAVEPGDFCAAA